MKMNDCFKLKVGDRIVRVRTGYQNMDHTKIPVEPKVYTISWKGLGGDKALKENVQRGFKDTDGVWKVYTGEIDNRCICEYYETFENYISGNYNKDIILDKSKWNSLEEFLIYKSENDHKKALEIEADRESKIMEQK